MKTIPFALSIGMLLACAAPAMSAQPTGPAAEYKIKEEYTSKSPDGATTIEQYVSTDKGDDWIWQFWARRSDSMMLLGPRQEDYPADFRFTPDSHWLVRMQKTGSGEASLFLYKLGPQGFVAATSKPIGDLAWAYFYKQPASRKVMKPDFHIGAGLLKGIEDNYRELGVNWPENRYLVIWLWGEVEPNGKHHQLLTVRGWRCRYDLQEGKFDVPESFAKGNAEALAPKSPGDAG
jgi:hypothetical protein